MPGWLVILPPPRPPVAGAFRRGASFIGPVESFTGDGTTGTGVAPSHSYGDNGSYSVTLTVTDARGAASAPATTTATIADVAPAVSTWCFSGSPVCWRWLSAPTGC